MVCWQFWVRLPRKRLLWRNSDENLRFTNLIRKNRCLLRDRNDTKVQRHSSTCTCCCVDVSSKPCCNLYACSVTTLWGDWFLSNNCSIWNKALYVTSNSNKTNYLQRFWNAIWMFGYPSIFQFAFPIFDPLIYKYLNETKCGNLITYVVSLRSNLQYNGRGSTTLHTGIVVIKSHEVWVKINLISTINMFLPVQNSLKCHERRMRWNI